MLQQGPQSFPAVVTPTACALRSSCCQLARQQCVGYTAAASHLPCKPEHKLHNRHSSLSWHASLVTQVLQTQWRCNLRQHSAEACCGLLLCWYVQEYASALLTLESSAGSSNHCQLSENHKAALLEEGRQALLATDAKLTDTLLAAKATDAMMKRMTKGEREQWFQVRAGCCGVLRCAAWP